MPTTVTIGLAYGKTSFFDQLTNTYITLDKPVQKITFPDSADLSKIAHALFAQRPALHLYEGKLPEAVIDAWKAKYDPKGLQQAKNRAEGVQAQSAGVVSASTEKAEEIEEQDLFTAASAEEKSAKEDKVEDKKAETKEEEKKTAPKKGAKSKKDEDK